MSRVEPEFYSRYAELDRVHWWFTGRRAILTRVLSEALGPGPRRILDFGCGTGGMLDHLDRFGDVAAVDGDPRAVEFCHSRGRRNVRFVPVGSPLPFDDDSFDAVTALDVLEHIEDDVQAMRELRRVLRPGGLLLATVPAFQALWGDQDEISRHFRRYNARQLTARLEQAGFDVRRVSYFNTILFAPIAVLRLARRLVREPSAERTDFTLGGRRLNRLLERIFSAEAAVVARGRLPFGVSLLALAEPAPRQNVHSPSQKANAGDPGADTQDRTTLKKANPP